MGIIFTSCSETKIDREEVLFRQNIVVEAYDPFASLSMGNGNFAFTTDITGLQTFPEEYIDGVSLGTMSNWGWHSYPNVSNYSFEETHSVFEVGGRKVPYRDQIKENERAYAAASYLRANPHRLHLGLIGLDLSFKDGRPAKIDDIKNVHHRLELLTGKVSSDFVFDGQRVHVEAYVHQEKDLVSAKVNSALISEGQLGLSLRFPRAVDKHMDSAIDFDQADLHSSNIVESSSNEVVFERVLDTTKYYVHFSSQSEFEIEKKEKHHYGATFLLGDQIAFSLEFHETQRDAENRISFDETAHSSMAGFRKYWMEGGFVDFGKCNDARARELERRTILSQYLTKIQSTGKLPPAETGLTANSWYGKFHLEMTWWHIAHFSHWNRGHLIDEQVDYYFKIFDKAKQTALEQGYEGVRWPKMLAVDGENAPSRIGSFLIWQQAHIIWFAEQIYKREGKSEVLNKFNHLVEETADFMADFAIKNEHTGKHDLNPPLIPAQEHWDRAATRNPPFELAYWYWGLTKAQEWRKRMGQPINEKWEEVRLNLADLDVDKGLYLGIEGARDSYDSINLMKDHPMVLGTYGILPESPKIDTAIMAKTLDLVVQKWDWQHTWGWDYPMAAMTAIRLGKPELALELLLKDTPKNRYHPNGHNYQTPNIKLYLPGNGGLLYTLAMMCAGWEGKEESNIGFPKDGNWDVKWENLSPVF